MTQRWAVPDDPTGAAEPTAAVESPASAWAEVAHLRLQLGVARNRALFSELERLGLLELVPGGTHSEVPDHSIELAARLNEWTARFTWYVARAEALLSRPSAPPDSPAFGKLSVGLEAIAAEIGSFVAVSVRHGIANDEVLAESVEARTGAIGLRRSLDAFRESLLQLERTTNRLGALFGDRGTDSRSRTRRSEPASSAAPSQPTPPSVEYAMASANLHG